MKEDVLKVGDKQHGFVCEQVEELPDLRATLIRLRHEKTGAELIHFANEDDNNVFSVAFRTTPKDSTGVAHILEHTALCGSERFPVRDPFFSMLRRSLNSFMNAFTANDWTMYPFSTQNEKDYYNLMDIYLDASFFPKLTENAFKQEGWRYEFEEPGDSSSRLLFKGIVYNEMKGAMSDPSSLMNRRVQKALYPTSTYHYNSGGEPENIPDLDWKGLKSFHASYYHPSNSRFFTYGDLPLEKHLKTIDEKVLSRFEKDDTNTSVKEEKRLTKPARDEFTYPLDAESPDDLDKKSFVSVSWLTCKASDTFEVFTLDIISALLLGNPGAPLYKALMDSKLGTSLVPGTGYDDENMETNFSAGLQGTNPEDALKIEEIIIETLEKCAKNGFSDERIEAVIHQEELANKEITGNHYPAGLHILFNLFGSWIHDGDPVKPLLINENIARLRDELKKGGFLERKIREHLLDNPHRVSVVLRPDREHGKRDHENEMKRLAEVKERLSKDEKAAIIKEASILQKEQEAEEDISVLPTLELSDIPKEGRKVVTEIKKVGSRELYFFDQPTNGISYFRAVGDTSCIPEELKIYVPLFCSIVTRIGAAGLSYIEMGERIEAYTGGISASASIWDELDNLDNYSEVIDFSAKALVRNHDKMFEILTDIFSSPDFSDLSRLHMLIGQIKTSLENSVPGSGHSYARDLAARHLTPAAWRKEQWSGIHQLKFIKDLAAIKEEDLGEVAEKMSSIAAYLLNGKMLKLSAVTEERHFESFRKAIEGFLCVIPSKDSTSLPTLPFSIDNAVEGWTTTVPVSYVANIFKTVPYSDEDSPKLQVLAKLLRSCYLHREIREKGGAYGGYASYSPSEGMFSFLSYRDPHIQRTLNVYNDSIAWVLEKRFSDEDLKEAILGVFGDIDKPLSPSGKGTREFIYTLRGITDKMRQKRREDLLSITRDDIMFAAEKHLKEGINKSSVAVISGKEMLEEASKGKEGLKLSIESI